MAACHGRSHLLIAHENEVDPLLRPVERTNDPVDPFAGIAVDAAYAPIVEPLQDEVTDCLTHALSFLTKAESDFYPGEPPNSYVFSARWAFAEQYNMALDLAAGPRTASDRARASWDRVVDALVHLRLSLPRGQSLPENVWRRRHHGILWMLWAHVVALFLFGLVQGVAPIHVGAEVSIIALCAWAARRSELSIRLQSCIATSGVMICSAVFTHLSGGYIEVHFHFFVMLGVIGLYQDWLPFALSLAWVLLHHGVIGVFDPESVYNHPDAIRYPWKWAGIHAFFVAGASVVNVLAWKLNEDRALRDSLTGLASAALLADRTEHALVRRSRHGRPVSLLFIDLDGFKAINDRYGHGVGDKLLMQIGHRLGASVRATDTPGRIGGDEFAVLLEGDADEIAAAMVAERILAAVREPMIFHGREMRIDASIGIAVAGDGIDAEDLLRNADAAMYVAKKEGRGRYQVYDSQAHQTVLERLDLVAELKHAIDLEEFEIHYQPIVSLEGGWVTGVEALIRWSHPTRGMLAPAHFIAVAEESGVIIDIGRWVLREACHQMARWLDRLGDMQLTLSVNISGRQLQDESLVRDVSSALEAAQLHPSRLVLEITENVFMDDVDVVRERFAQLKELGVGLALDDFGTGYSSLGYLDKFPIDIIKIDKTFVDRLADTNDDALAHAIIRLSETFGLSTVAEGIEEKLQADRLATLGCSLGQGYLYSRPIPPSDLAELIQHQIARTA
jgi:diguanylate cyclase (GGDEF)-like protein